MRIRSDLFGIVIAHGASGAVILRAGDTVPKGVNVADDLLEPQAEKAAPRRRRSTKASEKEDT